METLRKIGDRFKDEFQSAHSILSVAEYFELVKKNPEVHLRGSSQYFADMFDHFGPAPKGGWALFQADFLNNPVIGHFEVQDQIYRTLKAFARQRTNPKMILLHGPNGSAKSSLLHALMRGAETYSKAAEGALYTFEWIFPSDKVVKGGLGLGPKDTVSSTESYAKLSDEQIMARIPTELKDHPLLLIPKDKRMDFLKDLLGLDVFKTLEPRLPLYITDGDLSHRSEEIFGALLRSYKGDLQQVFRHIQVQRFYLESPYRKGLVTIEPQMHVDAHYQQVSLSRNLREIPTALHGLNLFSVSGDLIDGNRGIIEFSDLLKRPVDSFKYILGACETGKVNVGSTIIHLDCVFFGSCNEIQLDAFKEFPDFTSFKARLELIKVPYLLRVQDERRVYARDLQSVGYLKPVAPHCDWTLALWAILTRLNKPNPMNYPSGASTVVANLTALEKAKLLDEGEMPVHCTLEERKTLRANLEKVRQEYRDIPFYEGRMGASAREMKAILYSAAQNPEFPNVSPLSVLRELEGFVKHVSEYDYLKFEPKEGYHDAGEFIQTVRNEYLNRVDKEVRDCLGLYDSNQWEEFIKKYVAQVSLFLRKEKQKNPLTGKLEDPDRSLIEEFEKIVEAPQSSSDLDAFRNNVITQIGAWSLDHPQASVRYSDVFPDYWKKLEKHFYHSQKETLIQMHNAVMLYGVSTDGSSITGEKLAKQTLLNMQNRYHYTPEGAIEVITFLMKSRYQS